MKMNPKAQVFRLFFLFDGASLLPFPYDWPPVRKSISFRHTRAKDREEGYRKD